MKKLHLTETMRIWLKELYLNEAEEHLSAASNSHLFALGSENESASQWEYYAEEHREFAAILKEMAKELEED